ncbi:MAG: spermidine synthase [Novosphingobium sp.]
MIPRELLGTAQIPGGGELRLFRHDRDFMILLDRNELMSSRMAGSEEALATLSCERITGLAAPQVLIGGYGMGFTLRAALAVLPARAVITVAELVPEIIAWAQGPMHELAAGCLSDPRVRLVQGDVAEMIRSSPGAFDAILLDVDNGPDGLVREANDLLYSERGLRAAKAALRIGGVLAIWSAAKDDAFAMRLKRAGLAVEEVAVRARENGKGAKHIIWFAAKTPANPTTRPN